MKNQKITTLLILAFTIFTQIKQTNASTNIYFTPSNQCQKQIQKLINECEAPIKIAVYNITDENIVSSIIANKDKGVAVITNRTQKNKPQTLRLIKNGVEVVFNKGHKIMHEKFVVCGNNVEMGSYNWTVNAKDYNAEDCIVFNNEEEIANKFHDRFSFLYEKYKLFINKIHD